MSNSINQEIQNLYSNQLEHCELVEAQNALVEFFDLLIEIDREIESKEKGEENERN